MNSTKPTPESDDEAWLAELVRNAPPTGAREGASDADAFTARVMHALPPSIAETNRRARHRRAVIVTAAAALGCGVAALAGGTGIISGFSELTSLLAVHVESISSANPAALLSLTGISAIVSLILVSGGSLRRLI